MSRAPTVGLSMIVKNGGNDLRYCLESARAVVDQIVIADSGSTDDTAAIAAEFDARWVSIPWEDDFAKARNRALDYTTTDWVLILDADEALEPGSGDKIRSLLARCEDVAGYSIPIRNYLLEKAIRLHGRLATENTDHSGRASEARSYAEHFACRLFRRHPSIRYTGCIHELVEYKIQSLGMRIGEGNFTILHYGQLSRKPIKSDYYRKLGRLKVTEDPANPAAWYELGALEYTYFKNQSEALRCLYRAVGIAPRLAEPWVLISKIESELGNYQAALQALAPLQYDVRFAFFVSDHGGDLLHNLGRLAEARAAYSQALALCPTLPEYVNSIECKRAYIDVRLSNHREALDKLAQIAARAPNVLQHHDLLVKAFLVTSNLNAAARAAENTLRYFSAVKLFLRAAALWEQLNAADQQRRILETALRVFPDSEELQAAYRRLAARFSPGPDTSQTTAR